MPVTRRPPHRPVLALLAHTFLPRMVSGVEASVRKRMQDADRRRRAQSARRIKMKALPTNRANWMKKTLALVFLLVAALAAAPPAAAPRKLKLVLAIAVDQFRYDY